MKRVHVAMISAVVCAAMSGFGETPWYRDPGVPMTLRSAGFLLHARLPRGWTIVGDAITPPPALGPGCRVEVQFHRDREWNDFLVSVLDVGGDRSRRRRAVLKIDGHPAVSDEYVSGGDKVMKYYINLSTLESDSGAEWTLRKRPPLDEGDCELQFLALVSSVSIVRDAPRSD